jgi:hypothetical protein
MDYDTMMEHAVTADSYALQAGASASGTFLGETSEFWRGAAATYRLLAPLLNV